MMGAETKKTDIKVMLVGPIPPPIGGIAVYVKSLNEKKLDGVEYSLFNTAVPEWVEPFHKEGARSYASIFEAGIWSMFRKILYVLFSFFSLIWSLITVRPAVVHVFTCSYWGYWRNWTYILIARLFRVKTIFHLLNAIELFYSEVGNFQKILLRKSMNSADCYLLQSPGLEAWVKQYSREQVIGIWNGIDFAQIKPKSENPPEFFSSMDCPMGITVGNLSSNKGTRDVIEALKILNEQNVKIGWVFVGRGDPQPFMSLVSQYGLEKSVYFAGAVSEFEKWQFLHHASFFCLPSYAEGQPLSIIEAMACGLPVISTKVGSIPEMIAEGVNGILVNPGDILALKDAILMLVNDPEIGDVMGKASQKMCEERHNIAHLYTALAGIYTQLKG